MERKQMPKDALSTAIKHPDENTKPGTKLRRVGNAKGYAQLDIAIGDTVTLRNPLRRGDQYFEAAGFRGCFLYKDFEVIEQKRYVVVFNDKQAGATVYDDREAAERDMLQDMIKDSVLYELHAVSRCVPTHVVTHTIERLDT